jgi:hypothetical protein
MKRTEVEALFGRAAHKVLDYKDNNTPRINTQIFRYMHIWEGKGIQVSVWLDPKEEVVDCFWETPPGSWNFSAPKWAKP